MDAEEKKHIESLLKRYLRRLRLLEQRAATSGINTPAELDIEIQDLQGIVAQLQARLNAEEQDSHPSPKAQAQSIDATRRISIRWPRFTFLLTGLCIGALLITGGFIIWLMQRQPCLPSGRLTYSDYIEKGRAYRDKDYDCALKYFNVAITTAPDQWGAYWERGFLYRKYDQPDAAIQDFNKAISLARETDQSGSYYYLGLIYRDNKNDYIKSIDYFTKAINIDNNYKDAFCERAHAYELQKQDKNAIEDYQACLNFANEDNPVDEFNKKRATEHLRSLGIQP